MVLFMIQVKEVASHQKEFPEISFVLDHDHVTRNDSQRRFLAQHNVAILEQCCNHSKQCRNNDATLFCTKNRPCESSLAKSPIPIGYLAASFRNS